VPLLDPILASLKSRALSLLSFDLSTANAMSAITIM